MDAGLLRISHNQHRAVLRKDLVLTFLMKPPLKIIKSSPNLNETVTLIRHTKSRKKFFQSFKEQHYYVTG